MRLSDDDLRQVDKVFIVACGTSFHAGMAGRLAIEHFAQLPVEIEIASEFRYRDPVLDSSSLVVAISQSGETLDTMEAVAHAKATVEGEGPGGHERGRLVARPRRRRRPLHARRA